MPTKKKATKAVAAKKPSVVKTGTQRAATMGRDNSKIGKILLIISFGLMICSILAYFAPAVNLQFYDFPPKFINEAGEVLIGLGVSGSLFSILLGKKSEVICHFLEGGEESFLLGAKNKSKAIVTIQFLVIMLFIVLTIALLILLLTNKFKGKAKVALSVIWWVFLGITTFSMLLEGAFIDINMSELEGEFAMIKSSLGAAPLIYIGLGVTSLATSIVGSVFIKEKK